MKKLIAEGCEAAAIDRVKAPAGLDLGAITPEEIAMSILAEITVERRRGSAGWGQCSPHDGLSTCGTHSLATLLILRLN
jgi:xanthine/CO dehydrogenase XdhC/CoxF family maturation factor